MFTSKHNPNGASSHLDNGRLEDVIARFQTQGDAESLGEIIQLSQKRVETLIRFNGTARYCHEDELISDVNHKLLKAVNRFNPEKGSGFSFLSCIVMNVLRTSVTTARKTAARFVELDEAITGSLVTNDETQTRDAIDDLSHRIKSSVRTTLDDPTERDVQRWFVESFCEECFAARRHQCADACMAVYGVSHSRSRELHDITLLEVRRLLYDDLPPRPLISAGRLNGTRCAWMMRYRPLLSDTEFTKFTVLMRNLSPFLLLLIAPESRSRRQDRNPPIGKENLLWILRGHPSATLLFPPGY
jgi:hypothetical protein